ncbi:MAG: serine hydrolase [Lachnospiraceae bacterium]
MKRCLIVPCLLASCLLAPALCAHASVYLLDDGTLLDASYYRESNPDLSANPAMAEDGNLVLHYELFGRAEGRAPTAPDADPAALAISALPEFRATGVRKRHIYLLADGTLFDADYYRAQNPDIAARSGDTDAGLIHHFENAGQAEGRLPASPDENPLVLQKNALPEPLDPKASVDALPGTAKIGVSGPYAMSEGVQQALLFGIRQVTDRSHSVGFVMVDLQSGQAISYDPDHRFYSASSIKGPYVISLLSDKPAALAESRSDMILAVHISDNQAYYRLIGRYGMDAFAAYWAEAGNGSFQKDAGHSRTSHYAFYSPRQLARLWIANAAFFESGSIGEEAASWFTSPNASVIYSELHGTCLTRSKAGWIAQPGGVQATCDRGIVYRDGHPYVIAIMSDMPSDFNQLKSLVQALDAAHTEMVSQTE